MRMRTDSKTIRATFAAAMENKNKKQLKTIPSSTTDARTNTYSTYNVHKRRDFFFLWKKSAETRDETLINRNYSFKLAICKKKKKKW